MAQSFFPIDPVDLDISGAGWQDVDVSLHIATGATGVILHCVNYADSGYDFGLRKKGSTDDRKQDLIDRNHFWAMIGVNASRVFQCYNQARFLPANLKAWLVGYTMAGVTFFDNAYDKTPASGSWQIIDCSAECPNAIGLIFEVVEASGNWLYFALRKYGSSDARFYDVVSHTCFGAIIGCDTSQRAEACTESTDVKLYLVGYVTDGASFNTNAPENSLASTDSWLDLSALPANGKCMGFFEISGYGTNTWGLRKNTSIEDIRKEGKHQWAIVECDSNRIIEGYITSTNIDFFEIGYATVPAGAGGASSGGAGGVTGAAQRLLID